MTIPVLSDDGIAAISTFEGMRSVAYQDGSGVWTIGCGHTGPEVIEGLSWSPERCVAALNDDLATARTTVFNATHDVPTSPEQFAALVSLAFNIGSGAFRSSSVLQRHRRGKNAAAAGAFALWNKMHANGILVSSRGLTRRRAAEAALYLGRDWREQWGG